MKALSENKAKKVPIDAGRNYAEFEQYGNAIGSKLMKDGPRTAPDSAPSEMVKGASRGGHAKETCWIRHVNVSFSFIFFFCVFWRAQ